MAPRSSWGRPEKARGYYEQALDVCTRARFRPELALTRLEIAELLLSEADGVQPSAIGARGRRRGRAKAGEPTAASLRSEALEHLDFAIDELRDMKMRPALERALGHKGMLNA